jgi:hypothetical protein
VVQVYEVRRGRAELQATLSAGVYYLREQRSGTAQKVVILYHFEAKAFLTWRGDGRARPADGRALTAAKGRWPPPKKKVYNGKWY